MKRKLNRIRIEFKKSHQGKTREDADLTRNYHGETDDIDTISKERVSGKGDATRHRTVVGESTSEGMKDSLGSVELSVNEVDTLQGLVLRVHGLDCIVQTLDQQIFRCAVRRILKNMATDQRHVVVAGDRVRFRREGTDQGLILRIEPRTGTLSRTSRKRRHVIVANVDQILIVTSAAQPTIKPNLIDRFLITAEQNQLDACILINKVDLVDPASLQPLIGSYAQMGYRVMMVSASRGWGIDAVCGLLRNRQSVIVGQSGVGKSSILNFIEPGLNQRVQAVSTENQKGKHTTTTAEVFPLSMGGSIVDTPGIRQFQLYDIVPAEIAGLFRDLRPFASLCRFPNCTHQHESDCKVKDAIADHRLDVRRYESYCQILEEPAC
ncbi:MAG: ribosome small subunit-dependent GTPase A [Pirellulaceae bacterium]|nr:ribosome small subunit-dependent GTPase A [Pirellulaceae bacterium]